MNNEIKEIREYISCPQFGDNHYGKWGALRLEQRVAYKKLIEEIEDLKEQVEYQDLWRKEYLSRIDNAIEFVERKQEDINNGGNDMSYIQMTQLLEILKGDSSNDNNGNI